MKTIRLSILFFAVALMLQLPTDGLAQDQHITRPTTRPTTTPSQNRQRQNQNAQRQQQQRQAELQRQREEAEYQRQAELKRQREEAECEMIIRNLIANMVYVESGTFLMGATPEQNGSYVWNNEKPIHQVTVSSFSIGKYEVTQEEWYAVMGQWHSKNSINDTINLGVKRPVFSVSWKEAQEFINILNEKTGMHFRLPTEAEWEFAARGGNMSNHYKYSGSNYINDVAWYKDNSDGHLHDVGEKLPNELGLYDMSGNISEWCQDWYGDYDNSNQINPKGPDNGYAYQRVKRGGNWEWSSDHCRVSTRLSESATSALNWHGFRLAL